MPSIVYTSLLGKDEQRLQQRGFGRKIGRRLKGLFGKKGKKGKKRSDESETLPESIVDESPTKDLSHQTLSSDESAQGKDSSLTFFGQVELMDVSSPPEENLGRCDDNVEKPSDTCDPFVEKPSDTCDPLVGRPVSSSSPKSNVNIVGPIKQVENEETTTRSEFGKIHSGTSVVRKSKQKNSEGTKSTTVLCAALQTVSFSGDVIDAVERSQSDWKQMLEKMSNESEVIKKSISVPPIHCGSDRMVQNAKYDPWDDSDVGVEQPTQNGESGDKEKLPLEDEQPVHRPTGQKFSLREEDPVIPHREHNVRRREKHERHRIKITEERKEKDDSESAFEKGVGGMMSAFRVLGRTISNLTSDPNLPQLGCSNNAMYLFDCAKIDLESELHQSMESVSSPLNKSWFSVHESDSVSKLTNPQDFSALNSTFNGLNLSLDLTEISKIDDNSEEHVYNF